MVTLTSTLQTAQQDLPIFAEIANSLAYERKGVLYSEMFFLYAAAHDLKPKRILESGRARGQSTLLLSHSFPEATIISVEHDAHSPDVPVAQARLAHCANVELLFGDATEVLPKRIAQGDIVLIDGPKGFRGLRLAFRLLMTQKPALVFVHDCPLGSPEREFLDRNLTGIFYSDAREFVSDYAHLDQAHDDATSYVEQHNDSQRSYGFVFACIPFQPEVNYTALLFRLLWAGVTQRLQESWKKRLARAAS